MGERLELGKGKKSQPRIPDKNHEWTREKKELNPQEEGEV